MDHRFRFGGGFRILVWVCFVMLGLFGSGASAATPNSTGDSAAPGEALDLAAAGACDLAEPNTSFPSYDRGCDSGGFGASSCDLYLAVSLGWISGDAGCGVTCADGFYACCNHASLTRRAQCTCEVTPPPIATYPNPGDPLPLDHDDVIE